MANDNMIQLKNVSGRGLTLVLAGKHLAGAPKSHPARYRFVKRAAVLRDAKSGKLFLHTPAPKLMPTALRIAAGETVTVHADVEHCPMVARALVGKKLMKVADSAPQAPAAKDPSSASASSVPSSAKAG